MSEGSWKPKTWEEWLAATIWGVLILGFGLEFCAYLVKGDYGHTLVAAFFLCVVSAMLLHGKEARSWALSISPNWVYVAVLVALQILLFLPFIEQREWPFSAWFPIVIHDQTISPGLTGEQVKRQIADLQRNLTNANNEITSLKQQSHKLGPEKVLAIASHLWDSKTFPSKIHWVVFITYPSENQQFYNTFVALLREIDDPWRPWIMNAPDSSTDLDAPTFPAPSVEPGITLHGDNALNTVISQIFQSCFVVRRTDREIDGVKDWFNKRLSESERAENRQITWIEIGHGSPWQQGNRLSPDCFK